MIKAGDFQKVLDSNGVEFDNYCSDIHVLISDTTTMLVNRYEHKNNVTTFRSELNGEMYYEIPFEFTGK